MKLTEQQVNAYERDGFLVLDQQFSASELEAFREEALRLADNNTQGTIMEKNGMTVRGLHGCHLESEKFSGLVKDDRMAEPAKALLNCSIYVHQFKINIKHPFTGDTWPWHQDYIFWKHEDGIKKPNLVNVCLFLDDVNEFNGPLIFIVGSHRDGLIDVPPKQEKPSSYEDSPDWVNNLTADLKYSLPNELVQDLAKERPLVAPKAKQGSVMFFHPNLVHGSTQNISPFGRSLLLVTYNDIDNRPSKSGELARPRFLCSDDFEVV